MTRTLGLVVSVIALTCLACSDIDRIRLKAHLGSVNAQITLGHRYGTGLDVERDDAESTKWYRRAAEQGHAKAQLVLGNRQLAGVGVEDRIRSKPWPGFTRRRSRAMPTASISWRWPT